jgi:feruloyl esterase
MWAAVQDDEEAAHKKGMFVRVDFVLKPEAESDIRCRAELPPPEVWDGRMWGQGNSGYAGVLPSLATYTAAGTVGVTTDLGTWRITDCGKTNSKIWPKNIRCDYDWRATHLMTVYGKKIVEAFYGRPCSKAYFFGGSCGGRQAMSQAIRFPEDYDGIISSLPANNSAVNEIAVWHLWRQTHDNAGKLIFTTDEMRIVADAAVDFAKDKRKGQYNPFLAMGMEEADWALWDQYLVLAMGLCTEAYEQLPLVQDKAILDNILYSGVWLQCRRRQKGGKRPVEDHDD